MIKISVILPMYRSEEYLERVIGALKKQTMREFEAIFVDDGSPDESSEVCERLFDTDPRFRLIRKANGGVSEARNVGLDAAEGKYILFVDPDDWIEADTLEILWETAEKEEAELVFFGRINEFWRDGACRRREVSNPKLSGVYRDQPCRTYFVQIATSYFVTDKLFRRDIIEANRIRFRALNLGEDGVFFAEYLRSDPQCAVFLQKPLYHYTVEEKPTLSTSYHEERLTNNFALSGAMRETVGGWGLLDSEPHAKAVQYCTVRDLQIGIKIINLSRKSFAEKYGWLKSIMRDPWILRSVRAVPLAMAESRNDKIKLLLLKWHCYRSVMYLSERNQKRR